MSLLAPLYIAGALAVALPILFHLIRRTPQGRQEFSSLMFLAPSPPRITRRSRLSNVLLLLLRAAALCLLALAFARPFLRRSADQNTAAPQGRRVALMVDTSASMRRGDLWQQAARQVDKVLGELSPGDEVGLFLFDRQVRPAMTFGEWRETPDPARRAATLRARLAEAAPTWAATRLGESLATVAGLLAETDGPAGTGPGSGATAATVASPAPPPAGRQIILVSDVQQGAHAEALQGHEWPQNVLLDVRPVATKPGGNASVQSVRDAADPADKADPRLRVRVTNQSDSARDQFTLAWADGNGALPGAQPLKVYVPPGRGQTVRVPWPAPGERQADRLVLRGDEEDFDNTLFVVAPHTDTLRMVFVGDDAADDTKGLLYYLRSAAGDTTRQKVDFVTRTAAAPLTDVDLLDARLVVVGSALPEGKATSLRRWAEAGGTVLWVLKDPAAAQSLAALPNWRAADIAEAPEGAGNYALLARVDFEHPLFAPFSDSRFGDFTKIHFWKHRRVKLPSAAGATTAPAARAAPANGATPTPRVIATFDDGDPFLVELPVGKGRVLVATSGWHPADSQLALSTKFVPLISNLLRGRNPDAGRVDYTVNEPVALPQPETATTAKSTGAGAVVTPDGKRIEVAAGATAFDGADHPGVYRLVREGRETPLAVNLAPDEGRTAPLAVEELEHFGARLGSRPPPEVVASRQRQLQTMELENRQKLWRWLIVGVLGLLAAETALAGRLARRPEPRSPEPQQVVTT